MGAVGAALPTAAAGAAPRSLASGAVSGPAGSCAAFGPTGSDPSAPRVLLFRSGQGSPDLPRILEEEGVSFDDIAAYDTVAAVADDPTVRDLIQGIRSGAINAVTLTSGSCANALADAMGLDAGAAEDGAYDGVEAVVTGGAVDGMGTGGTGPGATGADGTWPGATGADDVWPATCRVVCLGPSTRDAAEVRGIRPCVTASDATVSALVAAVRAALSSTSPSPPESTAPAFPGPRVQKSSSMSL